ncbi:MAG: hypothetical protein ABJA10_05915 [Aestuariivirga sp.]
MTNELKPDFTEATPPPKLSVPHQALWWLKKGEFKLGAEWEKAHALCQQDEGARSHDLVHALCHWIEGDASNRDYWYRRIKGWTRANDIAQEWQQVWAALN